MMTGDEKTGGRRRQERERNGWMDVGRGGYLALFRLMDSWCHSLRIDGSLLTSVNGGRNARRRDRGKVGGRERTNENKNCVFMLSYGNLVKLKFKWYCRTGTGRKIAPACRVPKWPHKCPGGGNVALTGERSHSSGHRSWMSWYSNPGRSVKTY